MDELVIISLVIALTLLIGFALYLRSCRIVEDRKNERILQIEELKNERTRLSNEKVAINANRDITAAQIEAGVMGANQEEEGLGGLLKSLAPMLLQNPELLKGIAGKFGLGGGASTSAVSNGETFPASTNQSGGNTQ